MIQKDYEYCNKETCIALEELGCPIRKYLTIDINTHERGQKMWISIHEAHAWLREKKGVHVLPEFGIIHKNSSGTFQYYRVVIRDINTGFYKTLDNGGDDYETYEKALNEGINEAVRILKKNNI
jgi:hypothetical protein